MALGAVAIGAVAIGRLSIGRARIKRLEIDELTVRNLRVKTIDMLPDSKTVAVLERPESVPAEQSLQAIERA